jgi:hypothetical protein
MLSYNSSSVTAPGGTALASRHAAGRAHAAHALVLGFHSLCCGLPIVATLLASGAVGLVGLTSLQTASQALHARLHSYEGWVLAASALLVVLGGAAEWSARRGKARLGFPAFFAVSVLCLVANTALVVSHRVAGPAPAVEISQLESGHVGHSH